MAAGERERELQRRLVAAELLLERSNDEARDQADGAAGAAVRRLTEQRDAANAALQVRRAGHGSGVGPGFGVFS